MDIFFCILSVVCSTICFGCGCIMGWRAHITYEMAQSGELQKEPGAIIDVAPANATPTAEEEHKPGEFFW